MELSSNTNWYVLYTKPRWEKKVASLLELKKIANYCPLTKVQKQWTDRKKVIHEPLFKGYVFVNVEESKKWDVVKTDGVLNFIHWLGKPAIVKDSDIESIKMFLNEFENIQILQSHSPLKVNEKIIVKQGILMNYKGVIVELIGKNARVKIEQLGLTLSATLQQNHLEKIF